MIIEKELKSKAITVKSFDNIEHCIYLKNIATFGDSMTFADYSLHDHKHRFCAWAASTAAMASPKCKFSVEIGKKILESADVEESIQQIPKIKSQDKFDEWHKDMCNRLISKAKNFNIKGSFTFGVAAKLLNCYLKSYFIDHLDQFKFIHPPIDRELLKKLADNDIGEKKDFWRSKKNKGWSKFEEKDYSEIIKNIKETLNKIDGSSSLWKIEYYWVGYQSK